MKCSKHREKDIQKGCMQYLKALENQGNIAWHDRLNSGNYFIPAINGYRGRLVQGCRKGTSDAYAILNDGKMIWLEFKGTNGKVSEEQKLFGEKVQSVNHIYAVIRSVDDLINLLEPLI